MIDKKTLIEKAQATIDYNNSLVDVGGNLI